MYLKEKIMAIGNIMRKNILTNTHAFASLMNINASARISLSTLHYL